MIERTVARLMSRDGRPGKITILYGPRQVGKTTLARAWMALRSGRSTYYNCDQASVRDQLREANLAPLAALVNGYDTIVFDEAQRVEDIGLKLKILIDNFPQKSILATGSSSFELANKIAEPLTGRFRAFQLYPIGELELRMARNLIEINETLESRLIYGGYPEVVEANAVEEKLASIGAIADTYLFQDVLGFQGLKRADFLRDLTRLLAFQTGSEVSMTELGDKLSADKKTIARYIELLCRTFVIYPLSAFVGSGRFEQRKSITRYKKYFFYDLGVRNALINNFNPLHARDDIGPLWENYLLNERIKAHQAFSRRVNMHFWRTQSGAEVDLIEEANGHLSLFEFKWSADKINRRLGAATTEIFQQAPSVIHRDNYVPFVTE